MITPFLVGKDDDGVVIDHYEDKVGAAGRPDQQHASPHPRARLGADRGDWPGAPSGPADARRRPDHDRRAVDRHRPAGVGWIRLHVPPAGPFLQVVVDELPAIVRTPRVDEVAGALGAASVEVLATPGLVADRLMTCLVKDAAVIVEEGLATRPDVDTALRLGMNHPAGPFAILDHVGLDTVVTMLDGMRGVTGDPRYAAWNLLRRQAAAAWRMQAGGAA